MKIAFSLSTVFVLFLSDSVYAGSATWRADARNKQWTNNNNWTPASVPNGPSDTATFAVSTSRAVSLSPVPIELDAMVFDPGASAFTFTIRSTAALLLSGAGIENDSGITQKFVVGSGVLDTLAFTNEAAAGTQTSFTVAGDGTVLNFYNEASASSASFTMKSSPATAGDPPQLLFRDNSTAANANFTNLGGLLNQFGGTTVFHDLATAATATFTNEGGVEGAVTGGQTYLYGNVTADQATFINEGDSDGIGGATFFMDNATAANAVVTCYGSQSAGRGVGQLYFNEISLGGNGTLIANGGSNGGEGGLIQFNDKSDGQRARVELFGNGTLDIGGSDRGQVSIGSLEGDGVVLLGTKNLLIGSNNLGTTFGGTIQEDGAITKVGSGTFLLGNANTYTGGTSVNEGSLEIGNRTGSATGSGEVTVNRGTLNGAGTISGAVTIGSGNGPGATLAPGTGAATMTLQGTLTFLGDGSYGWRVRTTSSKADKVLANGITISSGALFDSVASGNAQLAVGTSFIAIANTAATAIVGIFSNLPDGGTLTIGNNRLQANYEGGDGNDLTLTVIP
jgi:autotransporter-associated beta strand protein